MKYQRKKIIMPFETFLAETPFARYYLFCLLAVIPVVRIFMRAGFKPWWAVLLAVPDIGFILCTVFLALMKWNKKCSI